MTLKNKIEKTKTLLKRNVPENWKYYTQTGVGIIFILSSLGTLFVQPISIIAGTSYLICGLYTIPDIRYRILYKAKIEEPRYSVIAVIMLTIFIGGLTSPKAENNLESQGINLISSNLEVKEGEKKKIVIGYAEIENTNERPQNYSIGIAKDGELIKERSTTIPGQQSEILRLEISLKDKGTQIISFYSSKSNKLSDLDSTGFYTEETVKIPYYLNHKTVKQVISGYSPIPQKKIEKPNITINKKKAGREVTITDKITSAYDLYGLMKKATANSYYSSKEVFINFKNISAVKTKIYTDYVQENGTVERREIFNATLTKDDASNTDWQNRTNAFRTNYKVWLQKASSYHIRNDLCTALKQEIACIKS